MLKKYGVDNPTKSNVIQNKIKATNLERYGCENAMQNEKIKNKTKETNLERYGVDNPFGSKEIRDKIKATCKERYGVANPTKSSVIQNKIKATNLERYGVDNPFRSKEIQDKIKKTWQENYGENIMYPMQVEEIKNKALDSFQFNSTGPCSRGQKYIHFLIGGVLNKRVCNSLVDICFEEEKIAIEYDGSGHFLTDIFNGNKIPSKEALLKEKKREDKIINNG